MPAKRPRPLASVASGRRTADPGRWVAVLMMMMMKSFLAAGDDDDDDSDDDEELFWPL